MQLVMEFSITTFLATLVSAIFVAGYAGESHKAPCNDIPERSISVSTETTFTVRYGYGYAKETAMKAVSSELPRIAMDLWYNRRSYSIANSKRHKNS